MNNKPQKTFDALRAVAKSLENCCLDEASLNKKTAKTPEFKQLSEYLGTNVIETAIFTAIFKLSYSRMEPDFSGIAEFFSMESFDLLEHREAFKSLEEKHLINSGGLRSNRRRYGIDNDKMFSIPKIVNENLLDDKPINVLSERLTLDETQFVGEIASVVANMEYGDFGEGNMEDDVMDLEKQCSNIQFINDMIKELSNDIMSRVFFYVVANDLVTEQRHGVKINYLLNNICRGRRERAHFENKLKNGSHELLKQDLIKLNKSEIFEDSEAVLTDKGMEIFLHDEAKKFMGRKDIKARDLIDPDKIRFTELYYDDETQRLFSKLKNTLKEENYNILKQGLKERGLPQGVTVLLYGHPGTGKTEMAMQLAKATGRKIMLVDISATKNCYFGDSEKITRKIFDRYRMFCRECELKPILLFNEADAVLSKRQDVERSNVAQTENTIQNILLEEMENLDGILIATTNMINNFDSAFDRRFLFKIRFDRPTLEAKTNIWKSKLHNLSEEDATTLARFDLSGGEINNVVRKVAIEELLDGNRHLPLNEIIDFCEKEKVGRNNRNSVGFR